MKKLFFLLILCLPAFYVPAQNKLLDLSVLPVNEPSNDSITVLVQFKARDVAHIQNIQLNFETQTDHADVLQKTATLSQQGNTYYTLFENQQTPVKNYNITLYCGMTKEQFGAYRFVRVVVHYNDNTSAFLVFNNN